MVLTSSNTGSPAAALNIVDYNVNVWGIREGQIRDYVYSDGTVHPSTSGSWVRQTEATYITNISGQLLNVSVLQPISMSGILVSGSFELWADVSGDYVRLYGDTDGTGGTESGLQVINRIRVVNLSGVEPVIVQLANSGDTSAQGVAVRVTNLSGTEPVIVQLANSGDTSAQGVAVRVTNLSGTEPAIVQLAHSGDTSGLGVAVRVTNLSGTEPIAVDISGSVFAGTIHDEIIVYTSKASNAAIAASYIPGASFYLENITMHQKISPTTSGYFIITLDSVSGSVFDTVLYKDGTRFQDLLYIPTIPLAVTSGDGIAVDYPNTVSGNAIGLRIVTRAA